MFVNFWSRHKRGIVGFVVTVFFFVTEALIHFNLGKKSGKHHDDSTPAATKGFILPSLKEFGQIIAYVLLFSFLSSLTMDLIERFVFKENKKVMSEKEMEKLIDTELKTINKSVKKKKH